MFADKMFTDKMFSGTGFK